MEVAEAMKYLLLVLVIAPVSLAIIMKLIYRVFGYFVS